ncbi:MAG: aldo/keto reductase [Paraburkholderia sp.]|uniref:aldo/keto reductase n=1 Tax=Paraburkholderia sp. TaxID=1926495 RepID=UPI00397CDA39
MDPRKVDPIVEELRVVAGALNSTPALVALAWLLGRDEVATVIVGACSEAQRAANLQAAELMLPAELRQQLDRVSQPDLPYLHWMQRFRDRDRF